MNTHIDHFDSTQTANGQAGTNDRTHSAYRLDRKIARELDIVPLATGQVATKNERGIMMAGSNPLIDIWIEDGFDGVFPLFDVGAAYGNNTIPALRRGANVVAIDCDETHLEYIRRAWDAEKQPYEGRLMTVYGKLPELYTPPHLRASGILCSEVIHFLEGDDVERSFRRFHEVLVPGGALCLTCADSSAVALEQVFEERRAAGHKWPGELTEDEFDAFITKAMKELDLPDEARPPYLHTFSPEVIADVATRAGFRVVSCEARMHPGYPEVFRGTAGRPNVQLVAFRA